MNYLVGALLFFAFVLAPYVTHIFWSLGGLFTGGFTEIHEYVLVGIGVFMPPVGWLHGFYLWFN